MNTNTQQETRHNEGTWTGPDVQRVVDNFCVSDATAIPAATMMALRAEWAKKISGAIKDMEYVQSSQCGRVYGVFKTSV